MSVQTSYDDMRDDYAMDVYIKVKEARDMV